jgi:hypothetical protein
MKVQKVWIKTVQDIVIIHLKAKSYKIEIIDLIHLMILLVGIEIMFLLLMVSILIGSMIKSLNLYIEFIIKFMVLQKNGMKNWMIRYQDYLEVILWRRKCINNGLLIGLKRMRKVWKEIALKL